MVGVGDDQVIGGQLTREAVERGDLLAAGRTAHDDLSASKQVQVKGMRRLAHLEHHVVADVRDVVDGALADGFEAIN